MDFYDNENNRRQFTAQLMRFDSKQLLEINLGVMFGHTVDQINLYARPEFDYRIIVLIRDCITAKMDYDKVKFLADPEFNYSQMIIIKKGFECGLSIDQVKTYTDPEMDYKEAVRIMNELINES